MAKTKSSYRQVTNPQVGEDHLRIHLWGSDSEIKVLGRPEEDHQQQQEDDGLFTWIHVAVPVTLAGSVADFILQVFLKDCSSRETFGEVGFEKVRIEVLFQELSSLDGIL